jgi:ATP-dependent helicase/nuclease subunit A
MVGSALEGHCETIDTGEGWSYLRWTRAPDGHEELRRVKPLEPAKDAEGQAPHADAEWLSSPARRELPIPRPLTPSGAASLLPILETVPDEAGVPVDPATIAVNEQARRFALERGTVTHLLLQLLPVIERGGRERAARQIVERHAGNWPEAEKAVAIEEAMALLDDPAHAALFGPHSQAEVNVAGNVIIGGRDVLVSGQIDRLAVSSERVEIADYKTNREAPEDPLDAPQAYVLQLALYRELMRQIYPGRQVGCRLIWTRSGTVSPVGDHAMDLALAAMTIE